MYKTGDFSVIEYNKPLPFNSLKAWEEENAEYATWNLIDDKQDTASC